MKVKSDINNNNESDMNANRNKYVNLKSDTTINDTNCDDNTIVLPSVKKIATLFQDDKNKHLNKSNMCPTKRSLEAGSNFYYYINFITTFSPVHLQVEFMYFQLDSEQKSPPGMLTVKGQNCNLSQVNMVLEFFVGDCQKIMILNFKSLYVAL